VKFSFTTPTDEFGYYSRLAEFVGADILNIPNLMLIEPANDHKKYKYTGAITAENINVNHIINYRISCQIFWKVN